TASGRSTGSKRVRRVTPETPLTTASHVACTSLPSAVTAPTPVTTTRVKRTFPCLRGLSSLWSWPTSSSLSLQQTLLQCEADQFTPMVKTQLLHDSRTIGVHRFRRDEQLLADFRRTEALRGIAEHLSLSIRQ